MQGSYQSSKQFSREGVRAIFTTAVGGWLDWLGKDRPQFKASDSDSSSYFFILGNSYLFCLRPSSGATFLRGFA